MIPPALKEQINKLRSEGKADDLVILELISSGWPKNQVEQSMAVIDKSDQLGGLTNLPPQAQQPVTQTPITPLTPASPLPTAPLVTTAPGVTQRVQTTTAPAQQPTNTQPPGQSVGTKDTITNYFVAILSGTKRFRVFLFAIVISVVASIQPSYFLYKNGLPFLNDIENRIQMVVDEVVPEELEVTLKEGMVSTNVSEPYYLTISQSTLNNLIQIDEENAPQSKIRLLAIDTAGAIEDFDRHQSAALLTSRNIVYYEEGEVKIQSLSGVPDMTVDREFIEEKISEYNEDGKTVKFFTNLIYLSPLLFILLYYLAFILSVLFTAFIIWLINKVLQADIKFSRLFALTGLLLLLPVLFLTIINAIPFLSVFHPWFNTAFDVAIYSAGYVIIIKYKKEVGGS